MNKNIYLFCVVCLLTLLSKVTLALETDRDQPVYIDSNTATYDDKKAISIYIGDVVTIQGSLRVDSDRLDVYFKDGEIYKMVATGNPAKYKQTPSPGKEDMHGLSLIGEFYPKKDLLILKKQAVIWQGGAKQSSDLIRYDTKNSLLKAGETETATKRVHTVILPNKKTETTDDDTSGKASNQELQ